MEEFKNYLSKESKSGDAPAIDLSFGHSLTVKADNKSQSFLNVHTINVSIKFYGKNMTLLDSANYKFINNELAKSYEKKLVNISASELNNKFMAARPEIIDSLYKEYQEKLKNIKTKIYSLNLYAGKKNDSIAIDDQFKGELIQVSDEPVVTKKKDKYEM